MTRSISSNQYNHFRNLLIEAREASGLSQHIVAERLGRPQSFVSKYERGERRLDVVEFLEVATALGIRPYDILIGLESFTQQSHSEQELTTLEPIGATTILEAWNVSPEELTILVEENPSLRGMILGYVAELKFREIWLERPEITFSFKHDDHNRKGKGDRVITYKGQEFTVEVKSLQTNSVSFVGDKWIGKSQVDASDRRTIVFPDGTTLDTTLLLAGQFDLLAVNIFAFENRWRFVFAKNNELPRSTFAKYTPAQRELLLASLIPVTWPPEPPFYADPYPLLEALYQERIRYVGSEPNADFSPPAL